MTINLGDALLDQRTHRLTPLEKPTCVFHSPVYRKMPVKSSLPPICNQDHLGAQGNIFSAVYLVQVQWNCYSKAFFFSFPEHVRLCVWPNAPQYSEETAAWVCVGWKGQSLQITSDFSDRKLGKNLRKLLSGPERKKKSKEEKNKFTRSAARKINIAFRCNH